MSRREGRQEQNKWWRPQGYRLDGGSLLVTTLAINLLSLALPIMTLQVYDRVLPSPDSGTLPVLVAGVLVAVTLEAVLRLTRSYMLGWAGAAYEHRVACGAMAHILRSDISALGRFGVGENLNRLATIGKLKDFHNGYSLTVLFDLLFVPVFLAVIIYIAGALAIVPAGLLMVFTLISLYQGQRIRKVLKARNISDDARYDFMIEGLEGIHTLKSFALENRFARKYEALQADSSLANYDVAEHTAATFNVGAVFSNIMIAAVIVAGAVMALNGMMTTGALIACILLSGRMMQPIQRALSLWAKYQDYSLSRDKVDSIFHMPAPVFHLLDSQDTERAGSLSLDNISFRHNDGGPFLFRNAGLHLRKGDCAVLSSAHGAGKTTLLEIMSGLFPVTSGEVVLDGKNILHYPPESLIDHIGYIQTEGIIFRGTIRENLTCFGLIEEKKVREMAALLKIDADIARLPAGLDTFLQGNATDNVTPGLKQRIALVRVLAPKPRVILFDDADRALDRKGYDLVYQLLARLVDKTAMIIVSDDYNLCSLANRAVMIEGQNLVEIPPPSVLRSHLTHQGAYQ